MKIRVFGNNGKTIVLRIVPDGEVVGLIQVDELTCVDPG